ncbi:hypothetical protein niasHT_008765 [Heterodera trifolii]|uniref:FLYWCH-type domain-containing protein n=1 Tax=Heterodera trifolii TaxID=157864 RepID=A0ABD2M5S3_9BILA
MKSIRKQIEQQLRRKAPKRLGGPSADYDDSSIFPIQREDAEQTEQAEYTISDDDKENRPLIEFQRGTTERGSFCIWRKGFRFTRIRGRWFRCSNRDCEATAALNNEGGEGEINGVLGRKEHNHLPDPACFDAEVKRNRIKTTTLENPRQKPTKVLAEVRADTKDETFVSMGTDLALTAVMRRQKRKIYGNMDRVNPLNVVLPDALLMKDGESTLLYDSRRVSRQGQSDLLDVLKRARKISVDGTFKVAPAAWTQCFVIGAFVNRRLALCVHALLPGKQRKYYEEALNAVKAMIAPSTPARVISDFETATIRAMRNEPCTRWFGCIFRLLREGLCWIARSARVFPHKRRIKYVLKEQLIGDALDEAEYNTDEDVMNILSLLSLQMQGYVGGLRARGGQDEREDHAEAED